MTIHFIFLTDKTKLKFSCLGTLKSYIQRHTNGSFSRPWSEEVGAGCCLINLFIPINLKLSDLQPRLTSPGPHYESFSPNLLITRHQEPISTIQFTISDPSNCSFLSGRKWRKNILRVFNYFLFQSWSGSELRCCLAGEFHLMKRDDGGGLGEQSGPDQISNSSSLGNFLQLQIPTELLAWVDTRTMINI